MALPETPEAGVPYHVEPQFPRGFAMLALLGATLALNLAPALQGPPPTPPKPPAQQQGQSQPRRRRPVAVRDSTADTLNGRAGWRRSAIRRPVTAEVLASAFKDPTAKTTLLHARAARMTQDSALVSYDEMSYQRISAGLGFTAI